MTEKKQQGRHHLKRGSDDFGHAFEHYVMQEVIAYRGYLRCREEISYWHTYNDQEVDAIIGDARIAIELVYVTDFLKMLWNGELF